MFAGSLAYLFWILVATWLVKGMVDSVSQPDKGLFFWRILPIRIESL